MHGLMLEMPQVEEVVELLRERLAWLRFDGATVSVVNALTPLALPTSSGRG